MIGSGARDRSFCVLGARSSGVAYGADQQGDVGGVAIWIWVFDGVFRR